MSSNLLFKTPGIHRKYMPIDVNAPKEKILELTARKSFSSENTWPYQSPMAGFYDAKNTSTKLILLNSGKKWSHLRGKTNEKQYVAVHKEATGDSSANTTTVDERVEKNHENFQNIFAKRSQTSKSNRRQTNPSRHFERFGCNYKVDYEYDSFQTFGSKYHSTSKHSMGALASNSYSAKPHISEKGVSKMGKDEEDELIKYLISIGKRTTGLQDKAYTRRKLPSEFKNSYNLNNPLLKRNERLYINDLCQLYSVNPLKKSTSQKYMSILDKHEAVDREIVKNKYKIHANEDFDSYKTFISRPRTVPFIVNCGHFDPRQPKDVNGTSGSKQNLKNNNNNNNKSTRLDRSNSNSGAGAGDQINNSSSNTFLNSSNVDQETVIRDLNNSNIDEKQQASSIRVDMAEKSPRQRDNSGDDKKNASEPRRGHETEDDDSASDLDDSSDSSHAEYEITVEIEKQDVPVNRK